MPRRQKSGEDNPKREGLRPSPGPNSADDENVENFQKKAGQIVQLCYNLIIRRSTPALAF